MSLGVSVRRVRVGGGGGVMSTCSAASLTLVEWSIE